MCANHLNWVTPKLKIHDSRTRRLASYRKRVRMLYPNRHECRMRRFMCYVTMEIAVHRSRRGWRSKAGRMCSTSAVELMNMPGGWIHQWGYINQFEGLQVVRLNKEG